ncbi:hypothetical protein DFH94DRAFT_775681 [Russula ochroleuca]|jgi:hypothetical protein|uniref:Uncharacterized protein n=1 Tax=Russula ochroleuca TaxID=152965 RepID=A0A9P5MM12_9AGAM|nr:hypothetical protein DFH94DRAFT_790253 [Russula ochroleuca]KAF8468732.1 hypothetical protein DFH94DRAFT_775681 [Russula ochroleuca]
MRISALILFFALPAAAYAAVYRQHFSDPKDKCSVPAIVVSVIGIPVVICRANMS